MRFTATELRYFNKDILYPNISEGDYMKKRGWLVLLLAAICAFTLLFAVACKDKTPTPPEPGSEKGQYVCLSDGDEYLLSLDGVGGYNLYIKSEDLSGTYTLEEGALTLKHSEEVSFTGSYTDGSVVLDYDGATLTFVKKVYYTVSFNTNGGSSIAPVSVVNGKMLNKPADPIRDGYRFSGWYSDESLKKPYVFNDSAVTGDFTLFAKWLEIVPGMSEYLISFDLRYDGKTLDDVWTVEGKLQTVPAPTREGYVFAGWWISQFEEADKLSYPFDEDKLFAASTTLFAVWTPVNSDKLNAPLAYVEGDAIKWQSVEGAMSYRVDISHNGIIRTASVGGTTYNGLKFTEEEPGLYEISVYALSSDTSKGSDANVIYYNNKALDRVSLFSVNNGVLVYNPVADAQNYFVSVYCGDENHKHENLNNGKFLTFDISNCELTDNGITIVVRAEAKGFASSSATYVYNPGKLAPVELSLSEDGATLSWLAVTDAAEYIVYVNDDRFNVGAETSFSLKTLPAGNYDLSVKPQTKGLISPAATTVKFEKTLPATPSGLTLASKQYEAIEIDDDDKEVTVTKLAYDLSWNAVAGATYEMNLCGHVFTLKTNTVDLATPEFAEIVNAENTDYTVSLRAKVGDNYSLWSDETDLRWYVMAQSVTYKHGTVSWTPVIGAKAYMVNVNNKYTNVGLNTSYTPVLVAGVNVIEVAFVDVISGIDSEYVGLSVYAYPVYLSGNGGLVDGEEIASVIYKSTGDAMNLPAPEKFGYDFDGWYNTPQGANTNGAKFKDDYFNTASELMLFAYFTPKSFEVQLVADEKGVSVPVATATVYYNQPFSFPIATNTDGTMAFDGWALGQYGAGKLTDAEGNSLKGKVWNIVPDGENALKVYPYFKSKVLSFVETTHGGVEGWSVIKGDGINEFTEVTIPATHEGKPVLMVGGGAFRYCSYLKVVNIPNTIKLIQLADTFRYAYELEAINIYEAEDIKTARYWSEDGVLYDIGDIDDVVDVKNPQSSLIVYPRAKADETFVMPEGKNIVRIEDNAFYYAIVKHVVIASSVSLIRTEAFNDTNMQTLKFAPTPVGQEAVALTIETKAFYWSDLETIELPARLASIKLQKFTRTGDTISTYTTEDSFYYARYLKEIIVEEGCPLFESVDGMLVKNGELIYIPTQKKLEADNGNLIIPDDITAIGAGAFIGVVGLNSVTFHSEIKEIGEAAFYNVSLKEIIFQGPSMAGTKIGDYAFYASGSYNTALTTITFEEGSDVASIGIKAFASNVYLETLEIPASMKEIGDSAFTGCTKLESVNIIAGKNDLVFGTNVFQNCTNLKSFFLAENVKVFPAVFSGCTALASVTVDENNPNFTSEDDVLYDKAKTEIIFYPVAKKGNPVLPETLVKIGTGVFKNNLEVTSVHIGLGVTLIDNEAFSGCTNLTKVEFEEGEGEELVFGENVFNGCSKLTSFEFPSRVHNFGAGFFAGTAITSIALPEGLEEIAPMSFYGLSALESITIPASVKKIGYLAFSGSYSSNVNLKSITFAENSQLELIEEGAFRYFKGTSIVFPASLKEFKYEAFYQSYLTEIDFEEDSKLTKIGPEAFYGSSSLVTVKIPKTVTEISYAAFSGCSKLENVIFEEGGTADLTLGAFAEYYSISYSGGLSSSTSAYMGNAFYNCTSLTSIDLPARTVEITYYCFYYCSKLVSITFGGEESRLANIGERAFYGCSALPSITIPNTLKSLPSTNYSSYSSTDRPGIGVNAFYNCTALKNVEFAPGGVDTFALGSGAFYGCTALEEITFPSRLSVYQKNSSTKVGPFGDASLTASSYSGYGAFYNCTKLQAINLEGKVEPENSSATGYSSVDGILYSYDGTKVVYCPRARTADVAIDDNATVISSEAFMDCKFIKNIDLNNVEKLEANALKNCAGLTSLSLPDSLADFSIDMITGCTGLKEIVVSDSSLTMKSFGGVIFSKDMTTLMYAPGSFAGTDGLYEVPAEVETIASKAFYGNSGITELVLPEGLTEIGSEAFAAATKLVKVTLPSTLTKISEKAFNQCSNLQEIVFPDEMAGAYTLGDYAFASTNSLNSITLPEKLTVIPQYLFSYSGVVSVTLPSTVTELKDYSFTQTKSLKNVNFTPLADGSGLKIGANVFYFSGIAEISLPEGLTEIGNYSFQGSGLERITLPSTLAVLGTNVFQASKSLKEVTFAENSGITLIGNSVFYDCTALEKVNIPASVEKIEASDSYGYVYNSYAPFGNCTSLKEITFEENSALTTIGQYTFYNCTALESLDLSAMTNLILVDKYAFNGTTALKTLVLPDSVTTFGTYTFYKSGIVSFTIPKGVTTIPDDCFSGCADLEEVIFHDGVTAIGTSTYSTVFYGCTSLTSFEVPATVTTLTRMFSGNTALTELTLPDTITSIPESFFMGLPALTSIVIPDSVTELNSNFAYCPDLQSVVLSKNLTTLPKNLFSDCKLLKNVELPAGVTAYPDGLFKNCESITSIVIPSTVTSLGEDCFRGTGIKTITIPSSITSLPNYLFANCTSLEQIVLHEGITDIGVTKTFNAYSPFYNCSALEKIELPSSATLCDYIFEKCSSLATVTFPTGITVLPNYMFKDCTSLRSIVLPSSVTALGNYMFSGCINLRNITLPSDITEIPTYCFENCTSLSDIALPLGVDTLGNFAFKGCKNLKELDMENVVSFGTGCFAGTGFVTFTIPSVMTVIPDNFFEGCEKLTTVELHDFVEVIGTSEKNSYVFKDCVSLKSFVFPETVTTIGGAVFSGCTNLKTLVLPSSMTAVPQEMFKGLTSLTAVELPEGITSIGANAFENSAVEHVVIPEGVTEIAAYAFNGSALQTIELPSTLTAIGNYAFANTKLETIELHEGLVSIGEYAFQNCASLTAVDFPSTLTTIGSSAFEKAGLLDIVIPATVTYIGGKAFVGTSAERFEILDGSNVSLGTYLFGYSSTSDKNETLKTVVIGEGVTVIPDYAFKGCEALTDVTLPSTLTKLGYDVFARTGLVSIDLPESLTEISYSLFQDTTSLVSVTVPASVTLINTSAFENCVSLTSIVFAENSSLTKISYKSFKDCDALVEIELPEGLTEIAWNAFENCDLLETISFPSTLTKIGDTTFKTCVSLKNVIFAEGSVLTEIAYDAFRDCVSLVSVDLPDSLKTLGRAVFMGCTNLTHVGLPQNAEFTTLDSNLFAGCTSLESIEIPDSVTTVSSTVFKESGLKSFDTPASVTSFGTGVFYGSALETFTVPEFMKTIPTEFFRDCKNLTEVIFHSNVTEFGANCFNGCSALTAFVLPASVTYIYNGAVTNMSGLQSYSIDGESANYQIIDGALFDMSGTLLAYPGGKEFAGLPNGTKAINGYALYGIEMESLTITADITLNPYSLSGITVGTLTFAEGVKTFPSNLLQGSTISNIVLPSDLTEIPSYFFQEVKGIDTFEVPSGVTKIATNAFRNSEIKHVVIPNTVTEIGAYAFYGCGSLESVTFEKGGSKTLVIGNNAFYQCTALTTIEIPFRTRTTNYDTTRGIGQYAFAYSGIVTVTFEQSNDEYDGKNKVLTFGGYAFYKCESLVSVEFPEWVKPVNVGGIVYQPFVEEYEEFDPYDYDYYSVIYCSTFDGCISLETVIFHMDTNVKFEIGQYMFRYCEKLTTLVLPANTYDIGYEALRGCTSLTEFVIPTNITYVSSYAFEAWTPEQTIYIVGDEDRAKSWGYSWNKYCEAQILYVTEEELPSQED